MAKNEVVVKDSMFSIKEKSNEKELMNNILRDEFFKWMEERGYDQNKLKSIFECKKINDLDQINFNDILRRAKKQMNISLTDMIMFFEETFETFKKLLLVFDGETTFELKKELSKKYHIKLDETNLNEILG